MRITAQLWADYSFLITSKAKKTPPKCTKSLASYLTNARFVRGFQLWERASYLD